MNAISAPRGRAAARSVACCVWIAVLGRVAPAGDPPQYVKGGTWHDTFLASAESLLSSGLEEPFEPFESGVVRGGEPARRISVDVSGARELWLFATGCPDVIWGVADWAEPVLIGAGGARTSVAVAVAGAYQAVEGQHDVNVTLRSGLYQKLRIGGRPFDRGINVIADSALRVPLDGKQARFEAWIGVDDWSGGKGSVRFAYPPFQRVFNVGFRIVVEESSPAVAGRGR